MVGTGSSDWRTPARFAPFIAVALGFLIVSGGAFAQSTSDPADIDWLQLSMGLFGGLALFLAGLDVLSEGLKNAAGDTLRTVLEKLTVNRFTGALTGAFVTGVLNSSSVTTALVVGFVTAGVMTLTQSVGVIMGANIGSTVTAQLLAFNLTTYSPIPVAVGFFVYFSANTDRNRYFGMMIMGLGLVFYGMGLMSEGMKPLRTYQPFMEVLVRMENPLLGMLAGAVFTGLVQSSAATVGIAIAMASEGLLTLPAGIALALGANIGTCATALLAAQDVLLLKDKIRDLADALFQRHALRLRANDPKYLKRIQMMMGFIEQLRHMYTLSKRIAKTQLPDEVAREAG